MMETEYTTSTGYKLFYSAIGVAAIGFAFLIFNNPGKSAAGFLLIFPLAAFIGGVIIIISQFKRKIVITNDSITKSNIFKTTTIPFDHIKGFRDDQKMIRIEPDDQAYSKITINDYASIGDSASLVAWLVTNFKDLDKVEYEEEKEDILHDATLGTTEEDRKRKFDNAKKYARIYSIGGLAFFFGSIILHRKMYLLTYILLIYPLAGIFLIGFSQGLVRLFAKKSSAHSSIFTGILFPAVALIIQSTVDTDILSYDKVWVPSLTIGFITLIVLYVAAIKKLNQDIAAQVFVALLISAAYGFGSTMQINCVFDQSRPQVFTSTVVDQRISRGSRSTSYYLTLRDWGPYHPSKGISVSKSVYQLMPVGTPVMVYLKKGTFNIPWFYITQ